MASDDEKERLGVKADLNKAPARRLEGIGGRTSITTSAGRKDYREKLLADHALLDKELLANDIDPSKLPTR